MDPFIHRSRSTVFYSGAQKFAVELKYKRLNLISRTFYGTAITADLFRKAADSEHIFPPGTHHLRSTRLLLYARRHSYPVRIITPT